MKTEAISKSFSNELNHNFTISWKYLLVFPFAWFLGIISLQLFNLIFPDNFAFISSVCGAILGIIILWFFFLRQIDKTISLPIILLISFVKVIFVYAIWTNCVFAPVGGENLVVTEQVYFRESYHYWKEINRIIDYWRTYGFTFFLPHQYLNINYPQAMLLISLPFTALPPYSEVLIPWNMFYTTAAACAIYSVGRLEGFKQRVCKTAFYLVLLQPFAWYVWEPLKRDTQCQMLFAIFLLAILIFRRRIIISAIIGIAGGLILSFYRVVYGPIIIVVAIYTFIVQKGRKINTKILKRSFISVVLVGLIIWQFPKITERPVTNLIRFYGVGNIETVVEKGYQPRIINYRYWLSSVPMRIIFGLMVPFPWTNIYSTKNLFEFFWKLIDYMQTSLMLVCFAAIALFGIRNLRRKQLLPTSVLFSLLVAVSGMFGYAVHNVYVQIGMLSCFPYVLHKLGRKRAVNWWFIGFCFFIISSFFWRYVR